MLWKPVWNVLEETPITLLLVNPRHVAKVPGRKTDVSDAEWIAQLLQCGLLRGSFIPPRAIRELRDLTRSRATLEQQRTAVINRIHKLLEDANIKLGAVAHGYHRRVGAGDPAGDHRGPERSGGARRSGAWPVA